MVQQELVTSENLLGRGEKKKNTASAVIWDDEVCLHGTSGKHLPLIREEWAQAPLVNDLRTTHFACTRTVSNSLRLSKFFEFVTDESVQLLVAHMKICFTG